MQYCFDLNIFFMCRTKEISTDFNFFFAEKCRFLCTTNNLPTEFPQCFAFHRELTDSRNRSFYVHFYFYRNLCCLWLQKDGSLRFSGVKYHISSWMMKHASTNSLLKFTRHFEGDLFGSFQIHVAVQMYTQPNVKPNPVRGIGAKVYML